MVEVFDHWSDFGLTSGERSDLLVIAENANDQSRETFGSIHAPYVLHRAGGKSPAAWKNTIGKLMKKHALEYAVEGGREVRGHPGQTARYRIPHLCPMRAHDGLWGQCKRDEEWVTPQVTHSEEEGHLSDDPFDGMGHLRDAEWVTSQVTPTPPTPPTTSAEAEAGDDGAIPGMDVKPKKKPKPKKPPQPPTAELIEARKITDGYFKKYGVGSSQTKVSVRKIVETTLTNGTDRDTVAWAMDSIGRTGKSVTSWRLTDAIADVRAKRGDIPGSMASRRTAAECSEHALPLPCSSCRGDIRAGDDEVPRRLLAEHGPEVRWDLAEQLTKGEAA
ncbi:hypothetical protein [Nocardiopsis synnemataformans]|uniref:hypothetical protein n=1 Tax=Nocardiopsis synnemataformans TaxID=61305 RepID=UPI003EBB9402